jgi:hypothetical protein
MTTYKSTRTNPLIVIKSEATDPDASEEKVRDIINALQYQVTHHFQPAWGMGATIIYDEGKAYEKAYRINVHQTGTGGDQGYLGYHFSEGGYPIATIFADVDLQDDRTISDTLSHEILEMIVDPACNLYAHRPARGGRPARGYFYEVCDAVQSVKYDVLGYKLCDFVFPEWFEHVWTPAPGRKFDHCGKLTEPFELWEGCYADVYEGRHGDKPGGFNTIWGGEPHKKRKGRRLTLRQKSKHDNDDLTGIK